VCVRVCVYVYVNIHTSHMTCFYNLCASSQLDVDYVYVYMCVYVTRMCVCLCGRTVPILFPAF